MMRVARRESLALGLRNTRGMELGDKGRSLTVDTWLSHAITSVFVTSQCFASVNAVVPRGVCFHSVRFSWLKEAEEREPLATVWYVSSH